MRIAWVIGVGLLLGAAAYWLLHAERDQPTLAEAIAAAAQPRASAGDAAPVLAAGGAAPARTQAAPAPATASEASTPAPPMADMQTAASDARLPVPVQGVAASALHDTFSDARSQGRVHDAIDIMAAAGTPVLAVADGHVEKLFDSQRGGLTLYQFDPDGRYCYYYAHLQRYADGLAEGQPLRRGQVIGYVGSSGNASADAPHLHFEVHRLGPERQWWKGEALNPYPLLTQAAPP